jgi:isocitrate dehydrogenase kinase/phosphatase
MTIHCGKIHDYLGMMLDSSQSRKFIIRMKKYLEEVMKHLLKDTSKTALSPAAEQLF